MALLSPEEEEEEEEVEGGRGVEAEAEGAGAKKDDDDGDEGEGAGTALRGMKTPAVAEGVAAATTGGGATGAFSSAAAAAAAAAAAVFSAFVRGVTTTGGGTEVDVPDPKPRPPPTTSAGVEGEEGLEGVEGVEGLTVLGAAAGCSSSMMTWERERRRLLPPPALLFPPSTIDLPLPPMTPPTPPPVAPPPPPKPTGAAVEEELEEELEELELELEEEAAGASSEPPRPVHRNAFSTRIDGTFASASNRSSSEPFNPGLPATLSDWSFGNAASASPGTEGHCRPQRRRSSRSRLPSASQTWPVTPQKSVTTPPAAELSLRQALQAGGGEPSPVLEAEAEEAELELSGQHDSKIARTAACCLGASDTLAGDSAASNLYETGPEASRFTTEHRKAGT